MSPFLLPVIHTHADPSSSVPILSAQSKMIPAGANTSWQLTLKDAIQCELSVNSCVLHLPVSRYLQKRGDKCFVSELTGKTGRNQGHATTLAVRGIPKNKPLIACWLRDPRHVSARWQSTLRTLRPSRTHLGHRYPLRQRTASALKCTHKATNSHQPTSPGKRVESNAREELHNQHKLFLIRFIHQPSQSR